MSKKTANILKLIFFLGVFLLVLFFKIEQINADRCGPRYCWPYNAFCGFNNYCCVGTYLMRYDCWCYFLGIINWVPVSNCVNTGYWPVINCNSLDGWSDPYCVSDYVYARDYHDYDCLGTLCGAKKDVGACIYIVTATQTSTCGVVTRNCDDYCNGKYLMEYNANYILDSTLTSCPKTCSNGVCQDCNPSCPGINQRDCSLANNGDGDNLPCNCDCGGYDVEEKIANNNCNDGIDNDCDGKTDKYDWDCNSPPNVQNLSATQNPCAWRTIPQVADGLAITFSWNYSDPDDDPQFAYEIWVDTDLNFFEPKFNFTATSSAQSYILNLSDDLEKDWLENLNWNTIYYWKIRVRDAFGKWSDWSSAASFTTPLHAFPYIDFDFSPEKPTIGEVVKFTDRSEVFGGATKSSWWWIFQDGNPPNSTNQNPTTTFSSLHPKTVNLTVTDSDGYNCTFQKIISPTFPLPKWKEIPATFSPKKFLANVLKLLSFFIKG